MADLRRLMWFLIGVLFVAAPMVAMAEGVQFYFNTASPYTYHDTGEAACHSGRNIHYNGTWRKNLTEPNFFDCFTTWNSGWNLKRGNIILTTCPDGTARNAVTLQCESICQAGSTWNGTTCENVCQAKAGNSYGTSNNWARLDVAAMPTSSGAFCDGQCTVTGGAVECVSSTVAGSTSQDQLHLGTTCTVQGPFKYTGDTCSQSGTSPMLETVETPEVPWWQAGTEAKDCAASGGAWGQVNGLDVCVRAGTGETVQNEVSTSNGTGTTTTTTNPDGTTTETTTTKGTSTSGDKATETTTTTTGTKDAAGNVTDTQTTTSSTQKPIADMCKENPAHASCVGTETGGKWAGSCSAGFTCSGDAVQCAISKTMHEGQCAMAVSGSTEADGEAMLTDAIGEGDPRQKESVAVDLQNAQGSIAAGPGLQDMNVQVMDKTIIIEFSKINPYLEIFGAAMLAIAWLIAAGIIRSAI